MNDWKELIAYLAASIGVDLMALKSGLFGGFLSLTFEKKRTPMQMSVFIITSALFAGYMGPLVQEWFELSDRASNGASFLIGFFAVRVIIPRIIELADAAFKDPSAFLGKKPKGK